MLVGCILPHCPLRLHTVLLLLQVKVQKTLGLLLSWSAAAVAYAADYLLPSPLLLLLLANLALSKFNVWCTPVWAAVFSVRILSNVFVPATLKYRVRVCLGGVSFPFFQMKRFLLQNKKGIK